MAFVALGVNPPWLLRHNIRLRPGYDLPFPFHLRLISRCYSDLSCFIGL